MNQQIQIAKGVYITDYRKNGVLKGLTKDKESLTNDVGLLLDQILALQSKINQLWQSNHLIQEEEGWQQDQVLKNAVFQNYPIMLSMSQTMKEKILWLLSLKYKPENQKMENMLNIQRIELREKRIQQQMHSDEGVFV